MPKAKATPVGAIGRCIYCRTNLAPLHEEHILAANLGGTHTLLEASCRECQDVINSQVETPCMRMMFRDIRYRRGTGSRRLKNRPKTLPMLAWSTGGDFKLGDRLDLSEAQVVQVPYNKHPTLLVLLRMNPPGILRGIKPESVLSEQSGGYWVHVEPSERDEHSPERIGAETWFNDAPFARLLAKTAHCMAVAHLGLDGFHPFLVNIILGVNIKKRWYFAGNSGESQPPSTSIFDLNLKIIRDGDYKGIILAYIRLFADLGAPTYCVVVGHKL